MERTWLDQREVGDRSARDRPVFELAHQVVVGRALLLDDRRARAILIGDEHVDAIARRGAIRLLALGLPALPGAEIIQILDHILRHAIEVGDDVRGAGVGGLQLLEVVSGRRHRDLGVEPLDPLAGLLLELSGLRQPIGDALPQLLHLFIQRGPLFLRQLLELLSRHGLALLQGNGDQPHRRGLNHQPLRPRLLVQLPQHAVALGLDVADRLFFPLLVGLALEGARDLLLAGQEQLLHLAGEGRAGAGRKADRYRPAGVIEVVDVAPVAGCRPVGGGGLRSR